MAPSREARTSSDREVRKSDVLSGVQSHGERGLNMRRRIASRLVRSILIALLISSVTISCGMFGKKETVVTITQVPGPVRAAIEKVTTDSKIKSIEKIERNGKVTYEVEYEKEGKELDAYFTEDGTQVKAAQ